MKHRFETDAIVFLEEGKLDAALLKLAEAEGAADPGGYVRWRLAQTKVAVERLTAGPPGRPNAAIEPVRALGPWALRVLLDALGNDVRHQGIPAERLLGRWGEEAGPTLSEAARSRDPRMSHGAVSSLLQAGGCRYPKLPAILKELWADPMLDPGLRPEVLSLYVMIVHEPIDRK